MESTKKKDHPVPVVGSVTIEDLPEPVMEYIFSYLSPYRDLKMCMLVNKTWQGYVYDVISKLQRDFNNAVATSKVVWCHRVAEPGPTISKRYSHSACSCGDSIFVFGGCTTANTTFNDLWRLDLTTRCWIRPLATGTYPPPKACATLIPYEDNLVLFGGWTHTSPFPLHQVWRIFNQLHFYNINTNRWTQVVTPSNCPAMAGHSATLHGDNMVVFGGIQRKQGTGCQPGINVFYSSNDIWVLNLKTIDWRIQPASNPPRVRYGHSQVALDDKHIIVVGGCGGPNMILSDIWLLTMSDNPEEWHWKQMEVRCAENAAPFLAFHPACKVGNQLVIMNRTQKVKATPNNLPSFLVKGPGPTRLWVPARATEHDYTEMHAAPPKPPDADTCVNGKKGYLKRHLERRQQFSASPASNSDEDESQLRDNTAKKIASPQSVPNAFNKPSTSGLGTFASTSTHPGNVSNKQGDMDLLSCNFRCDNRGDNRRIMPLHARPVHLNTRRNRQRQLEILDRMEQHIRELNTREFNAQGVPAAEVESTVKNSSPYLRSAKHPMCLYVMDISTAISHGYVTWREPKEDTQNAPEEIILYSLTLGRGEMIMFGGIQRDLNSQQQDGEDVPQIVSNSLHFMAAKHSII